jgi:hypothetical protein
LYFYLATLKTFKTVYPPRTGAAAATAILIFRPRAHQASAPTCSVNDLPASGPSSQAGKWRVAMLSFILLFVLFWILNAFYCRLFHLSIACYYGLRSVTKSYEVQRPKVLGATSGYGASMPELQRATRPKHVATESYVKGYLSMRLPRLFGLWSAMYPWPFFLMFFGDDIDLPLLMADLGGCGVVACDPGRCRRA